MNTLAIALMIVIALLLAGVIILLIQGRPKADMTAQRLELLERRLAESMYDLRGEQSTLARAARLENQAASDRLSEQIDKRVARLADMTDQNLERIRMTVDERLNQSLEQKFAQVNKCLGEVHQSLGQMQSLSCGVDELRRVLSNVKVRGTWGEMQLGNILKDILDRARYVENAEVRPHSGLRVEYALRLPGQWEQEVLLPIDAKFPLEDYQRLQQQILGSICRIADSMTFAAGTVHLIARMQRHSLAVIVVLSSSLQHHDSFAVTVMDVIAKAAARFKSYLSVHYYAVIKHAFVKIMFNNYVTIATEAVGADICFAVCYFHKRIPLFFTASIICLFRAAGKYFSASIYSLSP